VRETTADLDGYDYARVLAKTESAFWFFCDNYLELVKARRYGDLGASGAASASSAMVAALSTFLRLLAPFLPFVTEEVWSWWHDGSIHRAPWPSDAELLYAIGQEDEAAVAALMYGAEILSEVRKAKSERKVPLKTGVTRVLVTDVREQLEKIPLFEQDLRAAGFIRHLDQREGATFEVVAELELGDTQA
jgi:valyl-tRNA synthetase